LARLRFAQLTRDIDLVVFDKDGTLIDFDFTWSPRCIAAVDALIAERATRAALKDQLLGTMGIDPLTRRALAESPLVVGTVTETVVVAATVLHQAGEPWSEAILSVDRLVRPLLTAVPSPTELRLFPSVGPLFRRLTDAGVAIAVLTNDDRASTLGTLKHLGLQPFVGGVACADDPHGGKPDPAGLLHLAFKARVPIGRVAMVGDAIGDLITARRAGAAVAVGVLTGTANRAQLAPHADAILDDVGQIEVLHD
jgi:phosphoglycolate phosphatase-like HAD superfamily hydrolase